MYHLCAVNYECLQGWWDSKIPLFPYPSLSLPLPSTRTAAITFSWTLPTSHTSPQGSYRHCHMTSPRHMICMLPSNSSELSFCPHSHCLYLCVEVFSNVSLCTFLCSYPSALMWSCDCVFQYRFLFYVILPCSLLDFYTYYTAICLFLLSDQQQEMQVQGFPITYCFLYC